MHEYSLMCGVIDTVLAHLERQGACPPGSVKEVVLKVGALDVHSEGSCRQAYEMLVKGTVLEQARLEMVLVPPTLHCRGCGYQGPCIEDYEAEGGRQKAEGRRHGNADAHDPLPYVECPACGAVGDVAGGRGVQRVELVLDGVRDSPGAQT